MVGYASASPTGRSRTPTSSTTDYRLSTTLDTPAIAIDLVEQPDQLGSFGARGVGEHPIVGPGPAIANAVAAAAGVDITQIPVTPERLTAAIDRAQ